ncbi:hypothetical protein GGS24DRAFT_426502 [Hypoxylon argillaceum]|nr:hypothetical protein GGS24DRAFT_426502 [Hypoxylon argillaceum]
MAAPIGKPARTSPRGRLEKPIYARTSVLCNGEIIWKVGSDQDMEPNKTDPQRADLKPVVAVREDLTALNGLQIHRARALTPLEIKQPLRHVHSSLPSAVKPTIYTGDQYGSAGGVFSCAEKDFNSRVKAVFENQARADGDMNYNDFFRRLRRAEWFLWDIEAEKGHWVAVIAHLYKGSVRNRDDFGPPSGAPSPDFDRIDEWCVVSAGRSPEANAMVDRVKRRFPEVLKEGRIRVDNNSEINPAIWVPMDPTTWGSGIFVFAIIKALMHRITEFHCRGLPHQRSFWDPLPGWLNIDEVRAEMQGRAAQRCMAATGYRSRIAIEGVRRWIGAKEVVRANELRPRNRDSRAYQTGVVGEDGYCIPVDPSKPIVHTANKRVNIPDRDNLDEGRLSRPSRLAKAEKREQISPLRGLGFPNHDPKLTWRDYAKRLAALRGDDVDDVDVSDSSVEVEQQPRPSSKQADTLVFDMPNLEKPKGHLDLPPSHEHGLGDDSLSVDSSLSSYDSEFEPSSSHKQQDEIDAEKRRREQRFKGPLPSPPPYVYGWDDNLTDDSNLSREIPLTKMAKWAYMQQHPGEPVPSRTPTPSSDFKTKPAKRGVKRNVADAEIEEEIAKAGGIGAAVKRRLRVIDLEKQGYSSEEIEQMVA